MRIIFLTLLGILMGSCQEPTARKPIEQKSSTTQKLSIERNKQLLENENALLEQFIKTDSLHRYFRTDTGIRYYFQNKIEDDTKEIPVDEPIHFGYELYDLNNEAFYDQLKLTDTVKTTLSDTSLFPGIRLALWLLKEGEEAHFLIPSALAYGYSGDGEKIGANVPLFVKLKRYPIKEEQ